MTKVWIAQLKCPLGHCMLAAYDTADDAVDAEKVRTALNRGFGEMLAQGLAVRRCFICGSKELNADLNPTRFRTLEEAHGPMRASEQAQAETREFIARLRKAGSN